MREAIGATWIFGLVLTFIMLFTAYLAISVNYAKAFKIKSHIVSMIEENEGKIDEDEIRNYLVAQGYSATGNCKDTDISGSTDRSYDLIKEIKAYDTANPYACIYKSGDITGSDAIGKKNYYKVITFFKFDLPMIGNMLTFKVKGETKLIYDFGSSPGATDPL